MTRLARALLLVAVVFAGCTQSTLVVPGALDPRANLRLYLDAVVAGNCDAARAMTTASFTVGNGDLCGITRIMAYSIADQPARPNDNEVVYAATITTAGGDASMPDGPHTWFYTLTRLATNGEWRISGGGTGP